MPISTDGRTIERNGGDGMPVSAEDQTAWPGFEASPLVLVAIQHAGMRRFTLELLHREHRCRVAEPEPDEMLATSLARFKPDLLVVDDRDFPECCLVALLTFPPDRAIVIGPEPDRGYEELAIRNGAGWWIPRERVGQDLAPAIKELLARSGGSRHEDGDDCSDTDQSPLEDSPLEVGRS